MKILIITDAWKPQVNGVVRTYENLSLALRNKGHTVKIIDPSMFPYKIPLPGDKEIKFTLFSYKRLKEMIELFCPDHIHIAVEGPLGWSARKYCLRYNKSFTTNYHTQFPQYIATRYGYTRWLYKLIEKASYACMRQFHNASPSLYVATQSLEDELNKNGFTSEKTRLLRGVDFKLFNPDGPKINLDSKDRPVALYVGRIAVEKNIKAFLDMPWNGTKILIGDGPEHSALSKEYPKALFLGKKEGPELASYYRSADVFVFPSYTDTFGMVIVEALASGLPVAAFNAMGSRDIITQPFLGCIGSNLNKSALLALESGTKSQRVAYVRDKYNWEKVADQYLKGIKTAQEKRN